MNTHRRLNSLVIWGAAAVSALRPSGLILIVAAGLFSASGRSSTSDDFSRGTLPKSGNELSDLPYRFLVPPGYDPAQKYPLILFLHGAGEVGNDNALPLTKNGNGSLQLVSGNNQASYPAFMLVPQASAAEGWSANTLGQVVRAMGVLESIYSIDTDRIYVTGLSLGGEGTYHIVALYPFLFAAAVPMSAWFSGDFVNLTGIPIWAFHAADDPTVLIGAGDGAVDATRQTGGRVIYTRYANGGHQIWPTAYANPYLLNWMMAQRRNQPPAGTPNITIATPSEFILPPSSATTLQIAGTASLPGGVIQVGWSSSPAVGRSGIDPGVFTAAVGTSSWSVANAPIPLEGSMFMIVARGSSWATGTGAQTGGGETTINSLFWSPAPKLNLAPPTLTIQSPTTATSWNTDVATVNLSGTTGVTTSSIQAVTWKNNRGGEGIAVGNLSWSIEGVELLPGDNTITVTVRDFSNTTATATLLIHVANGAPTAPTILKSPQSLSVREGSSTQLSVDAAGGGTLAYQWSKNGIAIAGATGAVLPLNNISAVDAGNYAVTISNNIGSIQSGLVALTVADQPGATGRLTNLSVRALAGSGDQTLIVGFIVSGSGNLPVLIRGWGPALAAAPFNITNALSDPLLRAFRGTNQVAENDNWGTDPSLGGAFAAVGAYPFASGSRDAALSTDFAPGGNTAEITGVGGAAGVSLAELFDETTHPVDSSPRLRNVSARGQVGSGASVMIGGFIIGGAGPVTVLIRASGPTLAQFGVGNILADPVLELHANNLLLQTNDNWSAASNASDVAALNNQVGFAFPSGSKDAAILATLTPGAYSVVIRGAQGGTGVALLEIYEVN